jgi:hypothetical protein
MLSVAIITLWILISSMEGVVLPQAPEEHRSLGRTRRKQVLTKFCIVYIVPSVLSNYSYDKMNRRIQIVKLAQIVGA